MQLLSGLQASFPSAARWPAGEEPRVGTGHGACLQAKEWTAVGSGQGFSDLHGHERGVSLHREAVGGSGCGGAGFPSCLGPRHCGWVRLAPLGLPSFLVLCDVVVDILSVSMLMCE